MRRPCPIALIFFFSVETAGEKFPAEESIETGPERAPDTGGGLRRRTVAWRAPLRETAPANVRPADDDGFESLASHGSSEDVPGLKAAPPLDNIDLEVTEEDRGAWLPSMLPTMPGNIF